MAKLTGFGTIAQTLGQRNFGIYMSGASVSLVGTWVQRIAAGWLTWELTHSFVWLGVIGFAELFPSVVMAPIAGAISDRVDRKLLAIVAQCLACLQAVAMAGLTLAELMNIWILLGLTFFVGCVFAFTMAVRLALFPSLVERRYISSAIAINAAMFSLARFVGPAVGGFLIAQFGVGMAFAFNALTFLGFIVALWRIQILHPETESRRKAGLLADVMAGLRYAADHPGIRMALAVLVAIALGVKGTPEMLPGYVDEVLGLGVAAFAQLSAAAGIGAAIAAVWVAQRGRLAGLTAAALASLLVSGLSLIAFATIDVLLVGLLCMCLIGGAITVIGTAIQSLMQNAVDGAMRGRVMSLYGVVFRGGPALGALAMGGLAEILGLRLTFFLAAGFTILSFLWILRRARAVAQMLEAEPGPEGTRRPSPAPTA